MPKASNAAVAMPKASNAAVAVDRPASTGVVRAPRPINIGKYQPNYEKELERDSRPQRIVHYLLWAASTSPHEYTPMNVVAQAIFRFRNPPSMRSDHTQGVRSSASSVRKILQRDHSRDMDLAAGGIRATVDDDDVARVTLPKRARRLQSAKTAYVATVDLVDEGKIKDPLLRAYMKRSVREVLKLIGNEDFDRKLLPPTTESGE